VTAAEQALEEVVVSVVALAWEPIDAPIPYRDYFDTLTWALIFFEKTHPHQLKVVSTVVPEPRSSPEAIEPA
jgi:hypothetical protein